MKPNHQDLNALDNTKPWKRYCSQKFIMNSCNGKDETEMRSQELCHEFYSTYEFDKVCADDELKTKKIIKFRLGGRDHILTLLEFAHRLRLYHDEELNEEEDNWMKRKGAGTQRDSLICYRQSITKISRKEIVLSDEVLRSLGALIYYRDLDTTTLKELIDSEGRLIPEASQSHVPRVAIPRLLKASMQDLYERMGSMEIHQGTIERMAYKQSHYWDIYDGAFEHMAGVYNVSLQRTYNPPGYDQEEFLSKLEEVLWERLKYPLNLHHSQVIIIPKVDIQAKGGGGVVLLVEIPVILVFGSRKWTPTTELSQDELTFVLIWVKLHGVPALTFRADGLSFIATRLGTLMKLDSCTTTACTQSWGRMDYARDMIDLRVDRALNDTVVLGDLEDDGPLDALDAENPKRDLGEKSVDDADVENGYDDTTTPSRSLETMEAKLMREEKFRDLCEEVSNFVKVIQDEVKEVDRLSCKDVVKETVCFFRRIQKRVILPIVQTPKQVQLNKQLKTMILINKKMAYFPRLDELLVAANSRRLFEGMLVYCDRENARDLAFENGLDNLWVELLERTNDMQLFITELEGLCLLAKRYKILECLKKDKKQDLIQLLEIRKVILGKCQQVSRKIALIEKLKSL
nr:hypothetical protein [Tanacetum cinerariifolium]